MTLPTLIFGAFDRHNFGDLLFPHVAAALLPERRLIFAGLAERDRRVFAACRERGIPVVLTMGGGYGHVIAETVEVQMGTFRAALQAWETGQTV